MPRRPAITTQADIARVIRAAKQEGVLAVVIRTAKKKRLDDVRVGEPRSDNAVGGWK